MIDTFKKELREALENEKDTVEKTMLMFRIFVANYPKIGEILNQLRSAAITGDQWAKQKLGLIYTQLMEDLQKDIMGAMDAGIIRKVDPNLLAYLNVTLDEVIIGRVFIDDRYTLEEVALFVSDMLYHAFLTEKGREMFRLYNQSNMPHV